jgi:ATP-dependent DNA helicase PIF1
MDVPTLSEKQNYVIQCALRGMSLLITGPAGTGKSFTLKHLITLLMAQKRDVVISGSTGIAALGIGGATVNSLLGLGLGTNPAEEIAAHVKRKQEIYDRWKRMDVLVIDEISMITPDLFEKIDRVSRLVRHHKKILPFAGIQLILCGDFLQLPPINKRNQSLKKRITAEDNTGEATEVPATYNLNYCFQTDSWREAGIVSLELTEPFRQSDPVFTNLLNNARRGILTDLDYERLKERLESRQQRTDQHTHVAPLRKDVRDENDERFRRLGSTTTTNESIEPVSTYEAEKFIAYANKILSCDDPSTYSEYWKTRDQDGSVLSSLKKIMAEVVKNEPAPQTLCLKKGCRVILTYNLDQKRGLINGSQGMVIGFTESDPDKTERVSTATENAKLTDAEFRVLFGLEKMVQRKKSLLYKSKSHLPEEDFWDDIDVKRCLEEDVLIENDRLMSKKALGLPVVRFDNGTEETIYPHPCKFEISEKEYVVYSQIPLILGWSITVHKCQGMTLPKAYACFRSIFEYGQAYVMLSRVKSLEGLVIEGLDRNAFKAHPDAVAFYENLDRQPLPVLPLDPSSTPSPSGVKRKTLPSTIVNENQSKHKKPKPKKQVDDPEKPKTSHDMRNFLLRNRKTPL